MSAPPRPAAVPAAAVFNADAAVWELAEYDARGVLHGPFATFSADGTLVSRGSYDGGELEGALTRFSDGTPGAPPLRACCVPPNARELRAEYRAGRLLYELFFDERGRALCEDGTPWPERAPSVPASARYDETAGLYVEQLERGDGHSTVRCFRPDGALEQEFEVVDRHARRRRRFALDGSCCEDAALDERGRLHGDFRATFTPATTPYVDARIAVVTARYEHGEAVGAREYRDRDGKLLCRTELGPVLATQTARLTGEEPPSASAEELWSLADELRGSPREALAVAARALARGRDSERFQGWLGSRVPSLRAELATTRADAAVAEAGTGASALLAAVLEGAAPAVPLRALASALAGHVPAALDYFDASVLLAPEQALVALGRGLLCVEHGDPAGALAAAAELERSEPEAAASLRQFADVTYGAFTFAPARDGVTPPAEELVAVEAAQPLEAVHHALAVYATRLTLLRAELSRRARGTPPWLPPDVTALLPAAPLDLREYAAEIVDETEDGRTETTSVSVDERVTLAGSTRQLLSTARADWAALGWLCWSAGLERVTLPEALAPRPEFAAAAHQATVRCWLAHDQLRTSGLAALARKAQSFVWEGLPLERVPAHLTAVVAAEYLEVRAVFLWLLFPQNVSPFQADLRKA